MKISIFGTGYVGLVTGACLANLGHEVLCVDVDEEKIKQLNQPTLQLPFHEPGLKDLVLKNKEKGRLQFTSDVAQGANFGEAIFNCVGTPSKTDGSADLSYVFKVAENVAKLATDNKILINKSTVPPGTARRCTTLIQQLNPQAEIEVVSNPEFLAEGKAVYDFTHPDKIVVGAVSSKAFSLLRKIYTGRVRTYIPLLETDWETAEMIKYANNAFLATKISYINEIANLCDLVRADVKIVAQAMGMDYRISPKFLNAGVGYGGSCFPKDVRALIQVAKEHQYSARLLEEVDQLNERQKLKLLQKISQEYGSIQNRTLTVWGLAFKPNTSDLRESPSLVLITALLAAGAKLNVYDPIAMEEARRLLGSTVTYCQNLNQSLIDSEGIILVTEWDEFRNLNFSELGRVMKNKVVFDGRNIYEPELVREEGFKYYGLGRG